jgi:amino-acid N-acetyltransferase
MNKKIKLRKAVISDVPGIYKLIKGYAERDLMLPRALSELYENIQEFFVAEEGRHIIGCASLHVTWEDLAEIKSLAVAQEYGRKGLGSKFMDNCHRTAKRLGIKKVFALTFVPGFFKKHGYEETTRDKLPHKIWIECVRCTMFPDCKEIPLIKHL